ncbi:MAG: glyoxylate reductase [Candidatus Odinarchaeia archaeon]
MKPKIFVTREIVEEGLNILQEKFEVNIWDKKTPPSKADIIANGRDADGFLTMLSDPIDREVMENCSNLKIISQYAVGVDNIDIEFATKKGVYVTNTPGVLTEATADVAWALLMAVSRRIVEGDNYIRRGKWTEGWAPKLLLGREIYGKTIGIIGFGRIGAAVARRAKGFNMKILYYSKTRKEALEKELGAEYTSLEDLLKKADFITLHVPLTKDTYHLIGEKELKMMKKTAYLINTARGAVIDEDALVKALKEKWIAGAGLDVFTKEPIPQNNQLIEMDNVVLTPHIGSASIEARTKMAIIVAENLISFFEGKIPPNLVNSEVTKIAPIKKRI